MSSKTWKPYTLSAKAPWNQSRVLHLHRRCGFGATAEELSRDIKDGPKRSIDRLIQPVLESTGEPRLHPHTSALVRQAIDRNDIHQLKAAWTTEMWHGACPLRESLTLMWHNHLATSFLKVQDCDAMWRQNQCFRTLGSGSFAALLKSVLRDRAMLIWLDANTNRAGHPNENLARELMELFTLGEGHYSEADVQEVARALTGWTVDEQGVRFDPNKHDDGKKTILGVAARHDVDSVAGVLLDNPATSRRLAWRLCDHLLADPAGAEEVESLAAALRDNDLHIGKAVGLLIRSERFFAESELRQRIRPPVSLVVGGLREQGLHKPSGDQAAVAPAIAASWIAAMGQDLFQPPGVAGWNGGATWLGTSAIVQRTAFAHAIAEGYWSRDGHRYPQALKLAGAFAQLD